MSGKYILRIAEEGYLVQKNISLAFLKCIGVNVELCKSEMEYPEKNKNTKLLRSVFSFKFVLPFLVIMCLCFCLMYRALERP